MSPRPHILVIEDDVEIRNLLRDYLTREGFRVEAGDGGAALDRFRATFGEPDLVVLDIMLPGEDGLSICRRVRAASRVPMPRSTGRSMADATACASRLSSRAVTRLWCLDQHDVSSNRLPDLALCWSMIFSENRFPLFGIML